MAKMKKKTILTPLHETTENPYKTYQRRVSGHETLYKAAWWALREEKKMTPTNDAAAGQCPCHSAVQGTFPGKFPPVSLG